MSHRARVMLVVPALALSLTACAGTAAASPPRDHTGQAASVLDVGVRGASFTGVPHTVHPGTVTLSFRNTGTTLHMAAIARVADGHTAAEIPAYLASPQGQDGPPPWLQLVGGVDELDAGHRASWTGTLDAGSYALVSFSPDAQGRPEVADGFLAAFSAQGRRITAPLPATQATVTLGPGGTLATTPVPTGTTAVALVNDDDVPRTADITSIRPGRTYDDVLQEAQQGTGVPPSLVRLGGTTVAPHGRVVAGIEPARTGTTYVVFDLDHVGDGAIAHETVG